MGASGSKKRLQRSTSTASFRFDQLQVLTNHRQELERILQELEETTEEIKYKDPKHVKFTNDLNATEFEVHRMKRFIKSANKRKYNYLLHMLEDIKKILESKTVRVKKPVARPRIAASAIKAQSLPEIDSTSPAPSPKSSRIQLRLVKLIADEPSTIKEIVDEEASIKIQEIRSSLEEVKPKIYLFGGTMKSFDYCVILQEINNIKNDLLQMGVHDEAPLRREQKLAMKEADECLKLLESKASFNASTPRTSTPESVTKAETNNTESRVVASSASSGDEDDDYDYVYDSAEDLRVNKTVAVTSI